MNVLSLSVVIPTYNMKEHLPTLFGSLVKSGIYGVVDEIVVVDDGSTDGTAADIEVLSEKDEFDPDHKIRCHKLVQNRGRFWARYEGAKASRNPTLLFLDSRASPKVGFGDALRRLTPMHKSLIGHIDLDVSRNVFCLYWQRSHERIFWRHYRDTRKPLELTYDNFDKYLKGTTFFVCEKDLFIQACDKFEGKELLSDDTFLMKEMVKTTPIMIHPDLRLEWVPRENARDFVWRIWNRGPQFVEYHVFNRRGAFFWISIFGLAALIALIALFFINFKLALLLFLLSVSLVFLSTALFAKSVDDFWRMAPLHFAIFCAFSGGLVRGIWVNFVRLTGGQLPKAN